MRKSFRLPKAKEKKKKFNDTGLRIKVQLDPRTIIILKSKESLKFWLSKYPNAKVMAA